MAYDQNSSYQPPSRPYMAQQAPKPRYNQPAPQRSRPNQAYANNPGPGHPPHSQPAYKQDQRSYAPQPAYGQSNGGYGYPPEGPRNGYAPNGAGRGGYTQPYEQQYEQHYEPQYEQRYEQPYEPQYEPQYEQQYSQQHYEDPYASQYGTQYAEPQYEPQYDQHHAQHYGQQVDQQYVQPYQGGQNPQRGPPPAAMPRQNPVREPMNGYPPNPQPAYDGNRGHNGRPDPRSVPQPDPRGPRERLNDSRAVTVERNPNPPVPTMQPVPGKSQRQNPHDPQSGRVDSPRQHQSREKSAPPARRKPLVEALSPTTLPQDNAFPTFPTVKEVSKGKDGNGHSSTRSRGSSGEHTRPSTAGTASGRRRHGSDDAVRQQDAQLSNGRLGSAHGDRPRAQKQYYDNQQPSANNGPAPIAQRPSTRDAHTQQGPIYDQHQQGQPLAGGPQNVQMVSQGRPVVRAATTGPGGVQQRPQYVEPSRSVPVGVPRYDQQPPSHQMMDNHFDEMRPFEHSAKPVLQHVSTDPAMAQQHHGYAATTHFSPVAETQRPATATGQPIIPQAYPAQSQISTRSGAQAQDHLTDNRYKHESLADVYADYYSSELANPATHTANMTREAQIESEMPDFDNTGNGPKSAYQRGVAMDNHLNDVPGHDLRQPSPAPAYMKPVYKGGVVSQPQVQHAKTMPTEMTGFVFGIPGEESTNPSAAPMHQQNGNGQQWEDPQHAFEAEYAGVGHDSMSPQRSQNPNLNINPSNRTPLSSLAGARSQNAVIRSQNGPRQMQPPGPPGQYPPNTYPEQTYGAPPVAGGRIMSPPPTRFLHNTPGQPGYGPQPEASRLRSTNQSVPPGAMGGMGGPQGPGMGRPGPMNQSGPPNAPNGARRDMQPQPGPGQRQQPPPNQRQPNGVALNRPDGLPHHPAPVRPGLTDPSPQQAPRPPPVRQYNQGANPANGSAPKPAPAESRASVEQRRKSLPVTPEELTQLRTKVDANPNDHKTAMYLSKRLVEASNTLASENGRLDAKATSKNRERYILEAHKRIKRLAQAGYGEALFYLADCYGSGMLGLQVDTKEAFSLYLAAAKAGHAGAAYRTAVCCEIGPEEGGGTRKDLVKAVQWYRHAAQLKDEAAMYKLGVILLKGLLGQPKSVTEAIVWLKKAAEVADANNPHALHELALLYEPNNSDPSIRGIVVPDEKYARELFIKAAKLGYRASQSRLGQAYEYGSLGLPTDARNSIAWYAKAAAQGEHGAELSLSGWYLTGAEGILEHSDSEAYLWARKAASSEPPMAKAMFAMGYYTENGIGCPANLDDAKRWYGRAATFRFPKAVERLEELRKGGGKSKAKPAADGRIRRDQKRDENDCVLM